MKEKSFKETITQSIITLLICVVMFCGGFGFYSFLRINKPQVITVKKVYFDKHLYNQFELNGVPFEEEHSIDCQECLNIFD